MSDDEHSDAEASGDEQPSEAELALKKRRAATRQVSSGLDDEAKELLETNKQDRERMEEEIRELRLRNEKRKKEREIEEKRLAAERAAEDERRKAADEAKRKQKEEEEARKKRERDSKKAEYDKLQNAGKPNFVISKRSGSTNEEETQEAPGKKSREQLEKEKRAILKQRIVELKADGLDQAGLTEKAKELHKLIHRLESEKYDLEKRFKLQQVEMMELAERARQANRVGRDGVKRVNLGEGESDTIQERFAGAPSKIEMFSKYERQKDKRTYPERKNVFIGPQYILPPERIKPTKILKWGEDGMPVYEEIEGAGGEEGHGH